MSAAGGSGPTVLQTSFCAASDIANVVEGILWNTCFTYLQWYRKDVRLTQLVTALPAQVTESNTSDQRIVCYAVSEIRMDSESSVSFTSLSPSCTSSCSDDECAKFEATLEPPRGVEDPEAHEGTAIFVPCSQTHGDAFSHAFGQHECTTTANGRRDWYKQRMIGEPGRTRVPPRRPDSRIGHGTYSDGPLYRRSKVNRIA